MAGTIADTTSPVRARAVRTIDQLASQISPRSISVLAAGLTLLIGAGDLATGIETPFTILYILPIGLGTWFHTRRLGTLLSVLSTACLAYSLVEEQMSQGAIAWNVSGSILLFWA